MTPFLKWAGGKRWLFTSDFIASLPCFERYIEPFLGGAAGFFRLQPKKAVLSDINPELINLYRTVRDFPSEIAAGLKKLQNQHSKDFYYEMRSASPNGPIDTALRTLYLNRTCWNGLYRLNQKGIFNVPIGTKDTVVLPTDDFEAASRALQLAEIVVSDFEKIIDRGGEGDLLFVDPPYTVKHNLNGFVKYNEAIFTWADQIRLRDAVVRACNRGAAVILTNADHSSVRELYQGIAAVRSTERASIISGSVIGRSPTTEIIVRL